MKYLVNFIHYFVGTYIFRKYLIKLINELDISATLHLQGAIVHIFF